MVTLILCAFTTSAIKSKWTGNKWLLLLPTFPRGSLGDAQDFMGVN